MLLVIELTKVEIFVRKCLVSLFHLHLKIYLKNRYEERAFDHFHYIFFREVLQIESILLLYYEDI